jgi:hypothetical protein
VIAHPQSTTVDLAQLDATSLVREPFEFAIVPGFVRASELAAILRDFPTIRRPGSFPVGAAPHGSGFQRLLDDLASPNLARAIGRKFGVDVEHRPRLLTVRGWCRESDGAIHTDSAAKIVSLLLYLDPEWTQAGGRLRMLRSADDIDDVAAEAPAAGGTLVAFRRGDRSYHGHLPYAGRRRVVQLNWLHSARAARREERRHRVSAWLKGWLPPAAA